jgi:hypothetical protein
LNSPTEAVWHTGGKEKEALTVIDNMVRSQSTFTFGNLEERPVDDDNESVFTISAYADSYSLRSRTSQQFSTRGRTASNESSRALLQPISLTSKGIRQRSKTLTPIPSPMSEAFSSASSAPPQYAALDEVAPDDDLDQTPFSTLIDLLFDQEGWRETLLKMKLLTRDHVTGELEYIPQEDTLLPYNASKMQTPPALRKVLVGGQDFMTRQASLAIKQNGEWHVCGKEGKGKWMFTYRVEDRLRITGRPKVGEKVRLDCGLECNSFRCRTSSRSSLLALQVYWIHLAA